MSDVLDKPPPWVIEAAREVGSRSPCAKSKRGAVIYNPEESERILDGRATYSIVVGDPIGWDRAMAEKSTIVAAEHNAPPPNFACTGTEICKKECGKICNHAEERAIRAAGCLIGLEDLELVHVKVVDGQVVPGGGPSCWQCSRLIADTKLIGIWLYEEDKSCPSDTCPMCTGAGCGKCGAGFTSTGKPDGTRCEHAADERHHGVELPQGAWRFYRSADFHRFTLQTCGIRP